MDYNFPKGFYWGSATSGPQAEGASSTHGKGKSMWDGWYALEPQKFWGNIGPEDTSTFYENHSEDIKFLKATGQNSFRTSISWSRLFPTGFGEVNQEAVDFYNTVIDEIIAEGVEPFMNLHHFDMPWELQEIGGWENREVVGYYVEFAKKCFELFGDRVKNWFTFNEPIVTVEAGYMFQFHYPNVVDMKRAVQVAYNTQIASSGAIAEYKKMGQGGRIGVVLNLSPAYPRDEENPGDVKAARIADLLFSKSFLDPAVFGVFPAELVELLREHDLLPETQPQDPKILKDGVVDYLGVNYYQPRRVKEAEPEDYNKDFFFTKYMADYVWPDRVMNPHRGWEIYPKGIYDIAVNIRDEYNNIDWMISENGMGVEGEEKFIVDGIVEDQYRIDFFKDHLRWLHKGIEEGSNCQGYHVWTFIDCWSWTNSYKNRYGLVSLDLPTQKRTIKRSGEWFKTLGDNNGFDN